MFIWGYYHMTQLINIIEKSLEQPVNTSYSAYSYYCSTMVFAVMKIILRNSKELSKFARLLMFNYTYFKMYMYVYTPTYIPPNFLTTRVCLLGFHLAFLFNLEMLDPQFRILTMLYFNRSKNTH